MGYAITPDNRLEEDMTVSVSARCRSCGSTTALSGPSRRLAGRIGTAELIEAVAVRLDGPASCGHPLTDSIGLITSRYRLPGSARWVGASVDLSGSGDTLLRLASVDPADLGLEVASLIPSGSDDFDLARILGQPASVVAAWHGALMAERLGRESHFPCGPHLHLLVASDLEDATRRAGELGLGAEPLCVADCQPASDRLGPAAWLAEPAAHRRLWAVPDARGLTGDLIDEARAMGLGVATSAGALRLTLRSELLFEDLCLGPVIERAIAHARHPRLEAGFSLLTIRRQLARRAEVLHAVLRLFSPDDWRMAGNGREVILRRRGEETHLDLSCLAVASPGSLPGLLRSVLEQGEIPGSPGPDS